MVPNARKKEALSETLRHEQDPLHTPARATRYNANETVSACQRLRRKGRIVGRIGNNAVAPTVDEIVGAKAPASLTRTSGNEKRR